MELQTVDRGDQSQEGSKSDASRNVVVLDHPEGGKVR